MSDIKPKKFVGLHSHTTFSAGDAIGFPQEHIRFAMKNGSDALACTDHGNMNGFSHGWLEYEKLKKSGANFKWIPGMEAYFIPSLRSWDKLKKTRDNEKAVERELKRIQQLEKDSKKNKKTLDDTSGDSFESTIKEMNEIVSVKDVNEDPEGTVVENEEESKSGRIKDPLSQRNHLVLLPKNSDGLKTLFKLVSLSYMEGFYRYPRIDMDMLKREARGNIIALQACIAGNLSDVIFSHQTEPDWKLWQPNDNNFELIQNSLKNRIDEFKDALGEENYYLELQFNSLGAQHLANYHFIEAAKRSNTKLVATVDAHYSNPEHWRERELYKLMAWMSKSKDAADVSKVPQRIEDLKCELYPKNHEQVWDSYKKYCKDYSFYDDQLICDAIEKSWSIAHEQIDEIKPNKTVKLPVLTKLIPENTLSTLKTKFPNASDDDIAFKELLELAKVKLIEKELHKDQKYIDRLKKELDDIKFLKFSRYFLTYYKIMEVTQKELFTGNGRGSVSGSLLAYLLGISQVDPIRFGTLWERFLNKHKKGMPDIDNDWSDRDRAVKIIMEYFGENNVIPVSNFNQLQVASLIKDLARFFSIPFEEVNFYTNKMRNEALAEAKKVPGFDAGTWQFTVEAAERDSPSFNEFMEKMKEYPEFENALRTLFKQMRNVSRHAGGVVITENASDNMPLIKSGGSLQTPWPEGLNFRHLEEFGFLKFDILGLGTLRMFEDCIRKILKKEKGIKFVPFFMVRDWFNEKLHPDVNKYDDKNVYKNVYGDGRFAGIFQFVQKNVQSFIGEMKPKSIMDLAIATSIFRPGPLGIGADKLYLRNRKNPSKITYKHPLLKDVLENTSGLIIFQEQLQLIYHKLAGVPLEETDNVRKAFTKKDISNKEKAEKERQMMREDFANRCLQVNNIPKETSYDIFDEMEKFVAYSFNLSHAVAYAITSWQCAWFLTYYPEEWITTYIDYCSTEKGKQAGKEDPKAIALSEAKALGFTIGKPDINLSQREFTIVDGKLIPSFSSLKHVGITVLGEIEQNRPYKSLEDLLWNSNDTWRHSKFNRRAFSTLVKLGAFDSLEIIGENKTLKNYKQLHHIIVDNGEKIKKAISKKNKTHKEELKSLILEAQKLEDFTLQEKVQFSQDLSGTIDIDLIVTPEIKDYLEQAGIESIDNWQDEDIPCWAIIKSCSKATTKTGKTYMRLNMYGEEGKEQQCFCWNYNPLKDKVIPENTLIIGKFKSGNFGFSSFYGKIEILVKNKQD
jgi:DNA polymerase-3 subunit alpha